MVVLFLFNPCTIKMLEVDEILIVVVKCSLSARLLWYGILIRNFSRIVIILRSTTSEVLSSIPRSLGAILLSKLKLKRF